MAGSRAGPQPHLKEAASVAALLPLNQAQLSPGDLSGFPEEGGCLPDPLRGPAPSEEACPR